MTEFKVTLEFNNLIYTYGFECECKHDAEKFAQHIQDFIIHTDSNGNLAFVKNKSGESLGRLYSISYEEDPLTPDRVSAILLRNQL